MDDPDLAGYLRIEGRELEAGGLNWRTASPPPASRTQFSNS
jgi:hypothetical protein